MHPSIRALLSAGMVTPLNKTNDASQVQPKIRPIKCEDADCNLWSKAASRANTPFILAEVAPQQVGIGVSSANETMVHGQRMCYELASQNDQPLATYYADISKAHNDFERANTLLEIYRLAEDNPHLRPIATILHSVLSIQPKIFIRGKNGVPEHLCDSKRGGGQGNALTGIAFCLNINPVLKQMSLDYPNISTLAYQDDVQLQGEPLVLFGGDHPAFQRLNDLLIANGNQVNQDKGMAYASRNNDRDIIPDFIKQPFITIDGNNFYGYITNGIPMGSLEFINHHMEISAQSFNESALALTKRIAARDKMAARTAIHYSFQAKSEYFQRSMPPQQLGHYLNEVTTTLKGCYHEAFGFDIFSPNEHSLIDPSFTEDRFLLRSSQGGGGFRSPIQRHSYLGCLNNVLPQLIKLQIIKFEETSTVTLFPSLMDTIGLNSFDDANHETRFQMFIQSNIPSAQQFEQCHQQLVTRRDQLLLSLPELVTDEHRVLDVLFQPCESIGFGIKNLSKSINEAFSFLSLQNLLFRASNLAVADPRRISFLASQDSQLSNSLFTSWPPCDVVFTSLEFVEAVARRFGLPSPALRHIIGKPIKGPRNILVDAFGYNLMSASCVVGDHHRSLHDMMVQIIVTSLKGVGIPHVGGFRNTCKNIFSQAIAIDPEDDHAHKKLQGIIPDIVIKMDYLNANAAGVFQGRQTLVDIKMVSPGMRYSDRAFNHQEVVNKRAHQVNGEYFTSAKALDRKYNGTIGDDIGPVQSILLTYGNQGKVIGFAFGTFGKCSQDVIQLIDLLIDIDAQLHAVGSNIPSSNFMSSSRKKFITKLGHALHRGWSKILLERIPLLIEGCSFSQTHSSFETNLSQ